MCTSVSAIIIYACQLWKQSYIYVEPFKTRYVLIVNDSGRMAVYSTCVLITLVIRKSFLQGCLATSAHDKVVGPDSKGQFPSVSISNIHSSSLTLIRLTLQWDAPLCLSIIPSIIHVFTILFFLFVLFVLLVVTSSESHTNNNVCRRSPLHTIEKVTWLKRGN